MLGVGEVITMHYALTAGLHAVLERCWLGCIAGPTRLSAVTVRARAWLLDFFLYLWYVYVTYILEHQQSLDTFSRLNLC